MPTLEIQSIALRDLAGTSRQLLASPKLRGERPRLLQCEIKVLDYTCLIVSSPIGQALAGLRRYPAFDKAALALSQSSLVPDDGFYTTFVDELRAAGLERDCVPRILFAPYAYWSVFGTRQSASFGADIDDLPLVGRLEGTFIPTAAVPAVKSYFQRLLSELGNSAFVGADESLTDVVADRGFSEDPARSKTSYASPDYDALFRNSFSTATAEAVALDRLRELVAAKTDCRARLFFLHEIKHVPAIPVTARTHYPSTAWEMAALRSEYVKRRGAVWHFSGIANQVDRLIGRDLVFGDERDSQFKEILSNLRSFLKNVSERYPVILENPVE